MINVSISESHVSLDRYLSCYTSVEQMAIQIRHSTDVSFQRLGKFNLTVHVNKKFTELFHTSITETTVIAVSTFLVLYLQQQGCQPS